MSDDRPLAVAQHEAAHLVVGVALGLRLREAVVAEEPYPNKPGWVRLGYVWFDPQPRKRQARALTYAAGIAWDLSQGIEIQPVGDLKLLRALVRSKHDVEVSIKAAAAILKDLSEAHALCTRALLERDLRGTDIAALARGEWLGEERS